MKPLAQLFAALALTCLVAGCATNKSTLESRRTERADDYAALSAEHRALVDQGQIKAGLSEAAVFIAWGRPAQVLHAGDATGETTTWLYHGQTSDDYLFWRYHPVLRPDGSSYLSRTLDRSVDVRSYVSAELTFRAGQLVSWRTLPKPPSGTYFDPR